MYIYIYDMYIIYINVCIYICIYINKQERICTDSMAIPSTQARPSATWTRHADVEPEVFPMPQHQWTTFVGDRLKH